MEKFRYLYTTRFNEKKFCVLANKEYGVYILEILQNGELCYPQYEDYISFYKKIQNIINNELMYEAETGSDINPPEKENRTKKKWISCIPKVIKDGVLITAVAALILAGCATISKYSYVIGDILPGVAVEQREERAKKDGWEVEYDEELEAYILKSYIDPETGKKIIVCTTNDELKAYFPDKNPNPTYEDVRKTIYQNDKIPLEYKLTYCTGLKTLLEKMPNLDLFTLNLNAERVSVKKVSEVEGKQYLAGDYNKNTGIIRYIDTSDTTVLHEFLGHAMLGGAI